MEMEIVFVFVFLFVFGVGVIILTYHPPSFLLIGIGVSRFK